MATSLVSFVAVLLFLASGIEGARSWRNRASRLQGPWDSHTKHGWLLARVLGNTKRDNGFEDVRGVVDNLNDAAVPITELRLSQLEDDLDELLFAALNELVPETCRSSVMNELMLGSVEHVYETYFSRSRTALSLSDEDYLRSFYEPLEEYSERRGVLRQRKLFFNAVARYTNNIAASARPVSLADVLYRFVDYAELFLHLNEGDCPDDKTLKEDAKDLADITIEHFSSQMMESFNRTTSSAHRQKETKTSAEVEELVYCNLDLLLFYKFDEGYVKLLARHFASTYFKGILQDCCASPCREFFSRTNEFGFGSR